MTKEDFSGGGGCNRDTRATWNTGLCEGFSGAPVFSSWIAIYGQVGEVVEELGCSVAFRYKAEETRLGVDEFSVRVTRSESGIFNDVFEERNVGFDASNTEFTEGAVHSLAGGFEVTTGGGEFNEHRVVVWSNDSSGVSVSGVKSYAKSGSGTIVSDAAVVGGKPLFRVFSRDPTLDGEAVARDFALGGDSNFGFVKFLALCHEYLRTDKIDAGNAFGDGVFDLNARIHFDEEPFF